MEGGLQWLPLFFFLLLTLTLPHSVHGKIGTSARYGPPFSPTMCYGNDPGQFSSSNLFAAAGDEIWNNGAACGRRYLLQCISAPLPGTCIPGQVIEVTILDHATTMVSPASKDRTTIVLSDSAFGVIANLTAKFIFIDYKDVHFVNKFDMSHEGLKLPLGPMIPARNNRKVARLNQCNRTGLFD